jgi:hypothetical protein
MQTSSDIIWIGLLHPREASGEYKHFGCRTLAEKSLILLHVKLM